MTLARATSTRTASATATSTNEHGSDLSGRLHMNKDHMENDDPKKQRASRTVRTGGKGLGKGVGKEGRPVLNHGRPAIKCM